LVLFFLNQWTSNSEFLVNLVVNLTTHPHLAVKVKVKQSRYSPGVPQRVLRKLRLPDFVTKAQNDGRLSALRTGRLYPQEMFLVLISVRG